MERRKWGNLPHFVQYAQTFHPFCPLEDNATMIDDPVVSAHPHLLGCLSPSNAQCSFASSTSCHCLSASTCKQCRWENGSMCILPMETSFSHWNTSLLSQDENPIIGRIFAPNPSIWFFRCPPNRDVIRSLNPPNSHDPNGGTYVRIGGLLKEK